MSNTQSGVVIVKFDTPFNVTEYFVGRSLEDVLILTDHGTKYRNRDLKNPRVVQLDEVESLVTHLKEYNGSLRFLKNGIGNATFLYYVGKYPLTLADYGYEL